jgi:hypothetical protein
MDSRTRTLPCQPPPHTHAAFLGSSHTPTCHPRDPRPHSKGSLKQAALVIQPTPLRTTPVAD